MDVYTDEPDEPTPRKRSIEPMDVYTDEPDEPTPRKRSIEPLDVYMNEPPFKKRKLSRGLLEMKFMKKTKERVEEEEEKIAGEAFFNAADKSESGRPNYIIVESYASILDLRPGRVSFHGMNPEIEALMCSGEVSKKRPCPKTEDVDIPDEELAEQYLSKPAAKRFKSTGKRFVEHSDRVTRAKKLFLKPKD